MTGRRTGVVALGVSLAAGMLVYAQDQTAPGYPALVVLFDQWRAFERPPLVDGAPDYSAPAIARKLEGLKIFRAG